MGSLMTLSLHVYCWVWQLKNFHNRLTVGKVIGKSRMSCSFYSRGTSSWEWDSEKKLLTGSCGGTAVAVWRWSASSFPHFFYMPVGVSQLCFHVQDSLGIHEFQSCPFLCSCLNASGHQNCTLVAVVVQPVSFHCEVVYYVC